MATPAKTAEANAGGVKELTPLRNQAIVKMDGGPILSPSRIVNRFNAIRKQVRIGMERQGPPTTADRGLLAIPTGKEKPSEVWNDVPSGAESLTFIGDVGSTNWKFSRAEKNADGSISKEQLKKVVYPDDQVREITVSEFIDNMVNPLVEAYEEQAEAGRIDGPINIALKFGFPHTNEENEGRTDAIITDVAEDGTYSKGWKFTDWDPTQKVNVTERIAEKLRERGIDVASVVAKNDTNAVQLDEDASQRALSQRQWEIANIDRLEELAETEAMTALARFVIDKRIKSREAGEEMPAEEAELPELEILDAGLVGGGGTNGAAKGGINLEIGRAKYSFDDHQEDDGAVHRKMQEMGLVKGDKHAEQETGAIIVSRIAATLALLEEEKLLDHGESHARALLEAAKTNQKIVDEIAYGSEFNELARENEDLKIIQDVAQGELLRAGVNYGILIANIIDASLPEEGADPNVQYGLRSEGSVLLKGAGIKEVAVQVAQELLGLSYPPELIEADGDLGVASLAMSKKQLALAA